MKTWSLEINAEEKMILQIALTHMKEDVEALEEEKWEYATSTLNVLDSLQERLK
jgi:hypothetical protein